MESEIPALPLSPGGSVVFIRSDIIGHGNDELGSDLIINHMHHLSNARSAPDTIILMNAGVKLVAEGSVVLDDLMRLEEMGTTILACGTCLNFFDLKDRQKAGKASNMAEITNTLLAASKVITL
jgi:selenium metabolism protein YedF